MKFNKIFECPHPCGVMPSFDKTSGKKINGGVPQSVNMSLHHSTLKATFDKYIDFNDDRLIDFDFESWNPVSQIESLACIK